jgi:pimeloyl-ACP methyl ester carboxylesterase
MTTRATVNVDGAPISYLSAGEGGPLVLLLHGTYWSRVWQPVLDGIAAVGLRAVAVDFPGFGRSGGELTLEMAPVPALATWLERFLAALGHKGPAMIAGHDIGGGVAQQRCWTGRSRCSVWPWSTGSCTIPGLCQASPGSVIGNCRSDDAG